jgi:hypothetical protein
MKIIVLCLSFAAVGCVWDPAKNENTVEQTLGEIFAAQVEFKKGCIKDRDGDGTGEYGFLHDLAPPPSKDGGHKPTVFLDRPLTLKGPKGRHVLELAEHRLEILMQDRRGYNVWNPADSGRAHVDFQERSYLVSAVPRVSQKFGRYWYVMDQTGMAMKFPFKEFEKTKRSPGGSMIPLARDVDGTLSIDTEGAEKMGWQIVPIR